MSVRGVRHALASRCRWGLSRLTGRDVVLVYQVGKVGSHSILEALARAAPSRLVLYHVHFMMPDQIDYWWRQAEDAFGGERHVPASICRSVATARLLARRLRPPSAVRSRIITVARDPVAWSVSAFFAMQAWWPRGLAETCRAVARDPEGSDHLMTRIADAFFDAFPFHDLPSTWFHTDINAFLGVDLFAAPFPHERGYQIVRCSGADLLVLRTEDLARCARPALLELLGVDIGELPRANDASDKWYHPAYEAFRASLRPADAYLDRMYGSTYARHFYSDAERKAFRERWTGRPSAACASS